MGDILRDDARDAHVHEVDVVPGRGGAEGVCGGSAAQRSSGRCTLAARGMLEKKGSGGATPFAFGVGRCSALALHTDWRKVDRMRAGATHEKSVAKRHQHHLLVVDLDAVLC